MDDDRSTRARIRDVAIECFAHDGFAATTARTVAQTAGVSPGLVIHHFGSMDGLRKACDEHVVAVIRDLKGKAMVAGPSLDVLAALRESDVGPLTAYLARALTDDAPAVENLVDDRVDDAMGYIQLGVESGMMQPSPDPRGRAVLLTLWGLGTLVLHRHLERLLGVDITSPDLLTSSAFTAYAAPLYEIYGSGVFTPEFAQHTQEAVTELAEAQTTHGRSPLEGTP